MGTLRCSPGKASCGWVALTGNHEWFLALVTRLFLQSQVSDLHWCWSVNSITDQFQTADPLILPKVLNRSQSLRTEIRSLQFSLWTFCSWWFLLCGDGMKLPGGTSLASAGSFRTALSKSGNTWNISYSAFKVWEHIVQCNIKLINTQTVEHIVHTGAVNIQKKQELFLI